jgi:Zinc carboxypeptidase
MPYPRSAAAIEAALAAIATAHPATCTRTILSNQTQEGRKVSVLTIGTKSAGPRRAVVITGGSHAREWAPPDALVSLAERLLTAFDAGTSLIIPAHLDKASVPPITYPETQIPDDDVRRIVERLNLSIIALTNPDGRATSQAHPGNAQWRKNRRLPPTGSNCRGVDINRNFPFPGDYQVYYSKAAEPQVSASKDPCDFQNYIGPSFGSEPEVQNIMGLVTSAPVDFFVDVHSYSRKILHPWATDGLQDKDENKDWRNHDWDRTGQHGGRDGKLGGDYDEFFPNKDPNRLRYAHLLIGGLMRDAILRAAGADPRALKRSRYDVEAAASLYPAPGVASDWAFSLNITPGTPRPLLAFTIECGSEEDLEGGFQPPVASYPKIEREIHLALLALLAYAASDPPPPSP